MLSQLMALLNQLVNEVVFFVEEGPLKTKLIEHYLEAEETHGDILECVLEASVRIWRTESAAEQAFEGHLGADGFHYQTSLVLEDLTEEELSELLEHLLLRCPHPPVREAQPARNILRKKQGSGLLGISAAAATLGLCQRDLKALIPCSEVRIAEKEGDKVIEEYYWEKDLIGRFATVRAAHKEGHEANREDVTCVAEWCCDGDREWAKDLISEFLNQCPLAGSSPPRLTAKGRPS